MKLLILLPVLLLFSCTTEKEIQYNYRQLNLIVDKFQIKHNIKSEGSICTFYNDCKKVICESPFNGITVTYECNLDLSICEWKNYIL